MKPVIATDWENRYTELLCTANKDFFITIIEINTQQQKKKNRQIHASYIH